MLAAVVLAAAGTIALRSDGCQAFGATRLIGRSAIDLLAGDVCDTAASRILGYAWLAREAFRIPYCHAGEGIFPPGIDGADHI